MDKWWEICHSEDFDGDAVMDAWDWADLKEGHPDYPENPEEGVV